MKGCCRRMVGSAGHACVLVRCFTECRTQQTHWKPGKKEACWPRRDYFLGEIVHPTKRDVSGYGVYGEDAGFV